MYTLTSEEKQLVQKLVTSKLTQYFKILRYASSVHKELESGSDRGCGCRICAARYDYVKAKLALHTYKKRLYLLDEVLSSRELNTIETKIQELESKVKEYKSKYHKLKDEIQNLESRFME